MEAIYLYPSLPNVRHQELMMMMMTITGCLSPTVCSLNKFCNCNYDNLYSIVSIKLLLRCSTRLLTLKALNVRYQQLNHCAQSNMKPKMRIILKQISNNNAYL